ncbi:hypothetical protein CR513_59912, partial [Mucuna pruriens]
MRQANLTYEKQRWEENIKETPYRSKITTLEKTGILADKHCDAPAEDIEPCPLLLSEPCASLPKGSEGFADISSARAHV